MAEQRWTGSRLGVGEGASQSVKRVHSNPAALLVNGTVNTIRVVGGLLKEIQEPHKWKLTQQHTHPVQEYSGTGPGTLSLQMQTGSKASSSHGKHGSAMTRSEAQQWQHQDLEQGSK